MGSELFAFDAGSKTAVGSSDFIVGLLREHFLQDIDNLGFIIDDQDACASALKPIKRDVVRH